MAWPERNKVLTLGERNFDEIPFEQRNLYLTAVTYSDLADRKVLNQAKGVVLSDRPGEFGRILKSLRQLIPEMKDREIMVVILAQNRTDYLRILELQPTDAQFEQSTEVVEVNNIWDAAEKIARHDPGPPEGPIIPLPDGEERKMSIESINPVEINLSAEDELILKRAFWDCDRLFLTRLSGGRASMSVYKVQAWLAEGNARPRPLPFFLKIDDPVAVKKEMECYRDHVEHYLPFNLRPQIAEKRCVRTRQKRALVGTFVDYAVDLRTALRSGQAINLLFSLFETSLRGFRAQPLSSKPDPLPDVLNGFVSARINLNAAIPLMVEREQIAKDFGLTTNSTWIEAQLVDAARPIKCLIGPTHGDLHYGNVMIRGTDAVVIDFASIVDGPLTSDPAALEVSLMFGTDDEDKVDDFKEWRGFIDEIYGLNIQTLHPPALFDSQPGKFSWLRRSLRELRHVLLGCDGEKAEAKIVLGAYLMRYARLPVEHLKNTDLISLAERRHAYAMVVAERLAISLMPNPEYMI